MGRETNFTPPRPLDVAAELFSLQVTVTKLRNTVLRAIAGATLNFILLAVLIALVAQPQPWVLELFR